jgi:hypothetical protein
VAFVRARNCTRRRLDSESRRSGWGSHRQRRLVEVVGRIGVDGGGERPHARRTTGRPACRAPATHLALASHASGSSSERERPEAAINTGDLWAPAREISRTCMAGPGRCSSTWGAVVLCCCWWLDPNLTDVLNTRNSSSVRAPAWGLDAVAWLLGSKA